TGNDGIHDCPGGCAAEQLGDTEPVLSAAWKIRAERAQALMRCVGESVVVCGDWRWGVQDGVGLEQTHAALNSLQDSRPEFSPITLHQSTCTFASVGLQH